MRHFASLIVGVCALVQSQPTVAQQEPVVVATDKASYHWPVF